MPWPLPVVGLAPEFADVLAGYIYQPHVFDGLVLEELVALADKHLGFFSGNGRIGRHVLVGDGFTDLFDDTDTFCRIFYFGDRSQYPVGYVFIPYSYADG